jgi:phage nucleotide-binding protein
MISVTSTKREIHYVNILVYGESGVGKTTLCKTAPKPIILSAESGLLSLADVDIPVIEIKNQSDITEAHNYILKSKEFETVCIDSISEMGETILAEAKKFTKDGRLAYVTMMDKIAENIRLFRDTPNKHILFIAKQQRIVDEVTGKVSYAASIPGKSFACNLPYFFDVVGCMRIGKKDKDTYRYIQTQPSLQHEAKDRSGKLVTEEKPDITHLINKILGK